MQCEHAHDVIKGLDGLHWTVVCQLLRRGGLKNGPKVDPKAVDGRVAQLREQAKAEKDKAKSGWAPPEDYAEIQ